MASFAHTAHPSRHYPAARAHVAAPGFQHVLFDLLVGVATLVSNSVRDTYRGWAAARRQAAQDRMFWELAMTDHRVMAELNAIQDYAQARG
ncbi:MAG TPA: hypothetical protein VN649_07475 [Ramlibacter sp.]|nr:hypothetical protein [Ramlibacter sp.]